MSEPSRNPVCHIMMQVLINLSNFAFAIQFILSAVKQLKEDGNYEGTSSPALISAIIVIEIIQLYLFYLQMWTLCQGGWELFFCLIILEDIILEIPVLCLASAIEIRTNEDMASLTFLVIAGCITMLLCFVELAYGAYDDDTTEILDEIRRKPFCFF